MPLWGPLTKFTTELYAKYEKLNVWERDDKDWTGDEGKIKYRGHWSSTIHSWVSQARSVQDKPRSAARKALEQVEFVEDAAQVAYSIERSLAFQPMAFAHAYIQEQTALLCSNPPRGQVIASQEAEAPYVGALNQLLDSEFKFNNFDQTLYDTVYDGIFYNVGWWKTSVDFTQYGTFGQLGRINIDRIDPEDMHVDPRAKRLDWESLGYIVQQMELEIGEIREMYPITGFEIPDEMETATYSSMQDQKAEDNILSPVNKLARGQSWKRQKIKVYEAWFKDSRLKFVPEREDKETTDENGEQLFEKQVLKFDDKGYVLGNWVAAYPKGRCIVICEGHVLEDMPNRLPHGKCPFIPVKQAPSKTLFVPGDATKIVDVAIKMNDIISRLHCYMQSEIERPMHASMGVFPNNQYYKRVPNKSDRIIFINPQGVFMRPPAVEPPEATFTLLQEYQQYMDLISGSSAIMRGQIPQGAQFSADSISSMQQGASSRLQLKAKFLASAVKELTFQIMWLLRYVMDEKITVQVVMPDNTSQAIDWTSDKAIFEAGNEQEIADLTSKESYVIDIKAGTGTPNAQQAQQGIADKLYDMKSLTREALLDAYQWPNRQTILKQLDKKEQDDIKAESFGRAVGAHLKAIEKESGPGRRTKSEGLM